jgi:hypothetical protein
MIPRAAYKLVGLSSVALPCLLPPDVLAAPPPSTEAAAPAQPASSSEASRDEDADAVLEKKKDHTLGSQQDDRGPIGKGFGKRWIATPTVSSNPKLSTSFGATAIVFLRLDDSVASTVAMGGAYSVTNSWTAFGFGRFNFHHDTQRVTTGAFRGHAANSYDNFMDQGIALESTSNVLAAPLVYSHRLGERSQTDWWAGAQFLYVKLDQEGQDPTSSDLISSLGLENSDAFAFGPNVSFDSRDNTNAPTRGQNLLLRVSLWVHPQPDDNTPVFGAYQANYSYYHPFKYAVLAAYATARFTFSAPLIFQSSLSDFRAYTVGEQIAQNTMSAQVEARIPFGKSRFGAAVFGGVATLFNDFSDWGKASTYYPMGGGGLRFTISKQQGTIIRLEYAQGVSGARGIYLAMGQAFQ